MKVKRKSELEETRRGKCQSLNQYITGNYYMSGSVQGNRHSKMELIKDMTFPELTEDSLIVRNIYFVLTD